MIVRNFLRTAARGTLVFYTILVALTALAWSLGAFQPALSGLAYTLTWPIVAGVVAGVLITALKVPALRHVAATVDALGGTRDRLLTGLDFSEKSGASPIELLAARESATFAGGRDFRSLLPIRPPQELRWLVVPLATLAIFWWDGLQAVAAQEKKVAAAHAQSDGTVKQLEAIADQLRSQPTADDFTRQLAERLKQAAAQVRAEADKGHDGHTAALRELAELEQLVQELRRPGAPTPDEIKSLAGALAANESTKDAAKDLAERKFPEAAKKLAEVAKDEKAAAQAQKVLQQALDHLAQQKEQLSRQLEGMRQQAEQGGAEHQQLLQQLSDLLNEMQENGQLSQQPQPPQKPGGPQEGQPKEQAGGQPQPQGGAGQPQPGGTKPMTDDDLRKLLGALQRMKDQQQEEGDQPQPGDHPPEGEGRKSSVTMQSFSGKDKNGDSGDPDPSQPSGLPGSDKDKGTTPTPFGKSTEAPGKGTPEQLAGQLGEGESLSTLIPSAAKGDAKATRRYKELTNAAAAAAADAVTQENIPLGARFLIRRYFDAIRPK